MLIEVKDTGPGIEPSRARRLETMLRQPQSGGFDRSLSAEGEVLGTARVALRGGSDATRASCLV